jgi:tetratricopeptide (TPR) repeat protein
MIVKDEAPIIAAFLERVSPLIDAWAIMDTGSTDGTPDIIAKELEAIPGRLGSMAWQGFESSRNAAIELAQGLGDYLLFLDADDLPEITAPMDDIKAQLVDDLHYGTITEKSGTTYQRLVFARNGSRSKYRGVVHEVMIPVAGERIGSTISSFRIHRSAVGQGNRSSRGVAKYKDDAELLEQAITDNRDPDLLERYRFYLAQSYRDFGDSEKALENYIIRRDMPGGYWQERYISALNVGHLLAAKNSPTDQILMAYFQAREIDPRRPEAYFHIAVQARRNGMWNLAYEHAVKARDATPPSNSLFIDSTIGAWKAQFEVSLSAWHVGKFEEGLEACSALVHTLAPPEDIRESSIQNVALYAKHVAASVTPSSPTESASEPDSLSSTLSTSVELIENHQYDDAIALLESSLDRFPATPPIHYNLGVAFHFSGRLEDANTSYSTAISMDESYANAWYNRGLVRRDLGDFPGAANDLKRAVDLVPTWPAALQNLAKVIALVEKAHSNSPSSIRANRTS